MSIFYIYYYYYLLLLFIIIICYYLLILLFVYCCTRTFYIHTWQVRDIFLDVYEYTKDNWLDPYREKFVSAWTNRTINFQQRTTNRVEGLHALVKKYLPGHRSTLVRIAGYVDR